MSAFRLVLRCPTSRAQSLQVPCPNTSRALNPQLDSNPTSPAPPPNSRASLPVPLCWTTFPLPHIPLRWRWQRSLGGSSSLYRFLRSPCRPKRSALMATTTTMPTPTRTATMTTNVSDVTVTAFPVGHRGFLTWSAPLGSHSTSFRICSETSNWMARTLNTRWQLPPEDSVFKLVGFLELQTTPPNLSLDWVGPWAEPGSSSCCFVFDWTTTHTEGLLEKCR